jgi:hypothetical protein
MWLLGAAKFFSGLNPTAVRLLCMTQEIAFGMTKVREYLVFGQ